MVKNKALPDSARLCTPRLVILSLSLSLADLALSRLVSPVFSLSLADAVHPEGTPWILSRLDPGRVAQRLDPVRWPLALGAFSVSCFFFWPRGMWHRTSPTRIAPGCPAVEGRFSMHAPPGKSSFTALSVQSSGKKSFHLVVQPLPSSVSKTFPSPLTAGLSP